MLNNLMNEEDAELYNDFVEEQRSFLTPDKVKKTRGEGKQSLTGEHKWQVTEIQNKHHQIKDLIFLGYTNEEICATLNCSAQLVSTVKNSPIIKDQLALMHAAAEGEIIDINKQIKNLVPKVLLGLSEIINNGSLDHEPVSQRVRVKEFNNLLDRYMGKPTQNIKTQNINVHFTKEELDEMKMRAVEVMSK
jgi:hypothetical protein